MATIKVTGFPKKILRRDDNTVPKFWVRELESIREDNIIDIKRATIEFSSESDATFAIKILNGHTYVLNQQSFPITAKMDPSGHSPHRKDRQRRRTLEPKRRFRSRSPTFHDDASQLDMEIELLRKQRMVIEEERRLLIEREKLELMREFGPSASKELGYMDDLRYSHRSPERTEYRSRGRVYNRRTPPRYESQVPSREHDKPTRSVSKQSVPIFFMPCVRIVTEMDEYIKKYSYQEERGRVVKLIKDILRQRLVSALENMKYTPTREIIKLYRTLHPKSKDESLVKNVVAKMRAENIPAESSYDERGREENIKPDLKDSGVYDPVQIENDTEVKSEYALSLDATELGESPDKDEINKDWIEGGTSWLDFQ